MLHALNVGVRDRRVNGGQRADKRRGFRVERVDGGVNGPGGADKLIQRLGARGEHFS